MDRAIGSPSSPIALCTDSRNAPARLSSPARKSSSGSRKIFHHTRLVDDGQEIFVTLYLVNPIFRAETFSTFVIWTLGSSHHKIVSRGLLLPIIQPVQSRGSTICRGRI